MLRSQPLKWHGGKYYLASWIISNFPNRELYTHFNEPYAGGLAVLLAHDPTGKSETINDLNGDLTNFWQVLANTPEELLRILWATPLSEIEWQRACANANTDTNNIRRAADFFIKIRQSRQGLGRDYCTPTKRTRRGMHENVSAWWSAIEGLPEAHTRLRRIEVRNMDGIDFIRKYDHPKALFYVDPPYLPTTRAVTNAYQHEMSEKDHFQLLQTLGNLQGYFLLSGYDNSMYNDAMHTFGWRRVHCQIDNKASSKKQKDTKTEMLWRNYE